MLSDVSPATDEICSEQETEILGDYLDTTLTAQNEKKHKKRLHTTLNLLPEKKPSEKSNKQSSMHHKRIQDSRKQRQICEVEKSAVESSIPPESTATEKNKASQPLNLLCVFTDNIDIEGITSDLNRLWSKEDIKIILPSSWNVVVAHNAITVSDENKQNIRIIFQKPLRSNADYQNPNLTDQNYAPLSSTEETDRCEKIDNSTTSKNQMKKNTFQGKTTKFTKKSRKTKQIHRLPKKDSTTRKKDVLPLQRPLLLNYIEEKKKKQILMYKNNSLKDVTEVEDSHQFYEVIEKLLSRSVPYEGEPINLVFEPYKLIQRLKEEDNFTNFLIRAHSSKSKQDLADKCDFAQFIEWESIKLENKELLTFTSVAECTTHGNNRYHKCLRKNHSYVLTINSNSDDIAHALSNRSIRRKSQTAMKQVNEKKIVSSVFRHFFHFYSLVGGRIKSGAVITKTNSNYWLKLSGVATDSCALNNAEKLFITTAGRKVVLNIYDYIKFLTQFAKTERIIVTELVKQMMMCDISHVPIQKPTHLLHLMKKCTEESKKYNARNLSVTQPISGV